MSERTKTCPVCYSEIDARARKCPGCLQWQGRLDRVITNPGSAAVLLGLVFLVLFGLMGYSLQIMLDTGRDFTPYVGQVVVVDSQMKFSENSEGDPVVVVLAQVRNDSDVTWSDIEFEARFLDADGNLIDVGAEPGRSSYVTIHPGQTRHFRILTQPTRPLAEYVGHELNVQSASEADRWF